MGPLNHVLEGQYLGLGIWVFRFDSVFSFKDLDPTKHFFFLDLVWFLSDSDRFGSIIKIPIIFESKTDLSQVRVLIIQKRIEGSELYQTSAKIHRVYLKFSKITTNKLLIIELNIFKF